MAKGNPAKEEFITMLKEGIHRALPSIQVDEADLARSVSFSYGTQWDISSSIALRLAKQAKSNPADIASAIAKGMHHGKLIASASSVGGYVNAVLNEKEFTSETINEVIQEHDQYGASKMGGKRKVIIEYPSVNPNKPWHVGHVRNPLLGDSISRILTFCGYNVERMDYIDDLGLQMAEILWGMRNLEVKPEKKYDLFLGELYVEVNKRLKEPGVEDSIKNLLKSMENTKSRELKEVKAIAEQSVRAQYETAFNYGIYHDVLIWEDDVIREHLLEKALEILEKKGITKKPTEGKYAGCIVVDTHTKSADDEDESKVLVRSNGVATYTGKDVAFHMWKLGFLDSPFNYAPFIEQPNGRVAFTSSEIGHGMPFGKADVAINVIGAAQTAQQNVVREMMKLVGAGTVIHLSYGEVGLAGGSLSGRTGGWIGEGRNYTADDLLKEMNSEALKKVQDSQKIGKGVNPEEVARKVALSAIKFEFLKTDPIKKVTFDWQRALDFNANSGPYCLYMYARCSRILENSGRSFSITNGAYMERGEDLALVKKISECPEIVEKACRELKPNILTDYIMDLALLFGKFYEAMPVLKAGHAIELRLSIVWATRQTLNNILGLLGIQTVERM